MKKFKLGKDFENLIQEIKMTDDKDEFVKNEDKDFYFPDASLTVALYPIKQSIAELIKSKSNNPYAKMNITLNNHGIATYHVEILLSLLRLLYKHKYTKIEIETFENQPIKIMTNDFIIYVAPTTH